MIRRDFLKKAMTVPAVIATERAVSSIAGQYVSNDTISKDNKPLSPHIHDQVESDSIIQNPNHTRDKIKPKALRDGSRVAFTAPASAASKYMINRGVATFETFGCEVVIGETIKYQDRSYKYFSSSEQQREEELMMFIEDDSIDAIICGRGGYGVMRILDRLNWDIVRANPKILMGFSDITALVNPIFSKCGIISFHGPVGYSSFNRFTTDYVRKLLFNDNWQNLEIPFGGAEHFGSKETVSGELVGGNLKLLVSLMGTPYEPDFNGKILFIEDVSEQPYKIDRMLTQLRLAGVFDKIKAVLVGNIGSLDAKHNFKPYGSFTIREVFEQLLSPIGIPVMANLPFGHTKNNLTMPIGTLVTIYPETNKMIFEERPVS